VTAMVLHEYSYIVFYLHVHFAYHYSHDATAVDVIDRGLPYYYVAIALDNTAAAMAYNDVVLDSMDYNPEVTMM
jgi:hypothetical protein